MKGVITGMRNIVYDGYMGPRLDRATQLRRLKNVIEGELTPCQRRVVEGIYFRKCTVTSLAEELGVSRTTLWRMAKRQSELERRQREQSEQK